MTQQSSDSVCLPAGMPLRDRFLGCLLGCAVGDALGAPFEGMWSHSIPGDEALLAGFAEFEGYPRGQFTDDTQLTLATVRSILATGEVAPAHVARSIAALWRRQEVIGPGGACTSAAHQFLRTREWTTCGAAVGQAGNGTAMRTAVLGLVFLRRPEHLPEAVADVSRITHQDPRSIAGGVAVAKAAQLLACEGHEGAQPFCSQIADVVASFSPEFAEMVNRLPLLAWQPPDVALPAIAWAGMPRPEFGMPIITPFVIPTVLAALWCLLRRPDSWAGAVASAIRLGGDVDTLGAIVGALAGVRLGVGAIPRHLQEAVQEREQIEGLALRLHALVASGDTP
jgi:ADP-ribosyl-[dinitrogen reductase] hydrolase